MADFLLIIVVLFAVVLVVSAPFRRARRPQLSGGAELGELEAARDAKYRELRDAELDHRTGKLSDADYLAVDQSLRTEAIDILRSIDRERGIDPDAPLLEPDAREPAASAPAEAE